MPSLEELLAARGTPEGQAFGGLLQKLPAGAGYFGGLDYMNRVQNENRIKQKIGQAEQERAIMTDLVRQAGGDPEKAIKALIGVGTPDAIELATKMKAFVPQPKGPLILPEGATAVHPTTGQVIARGAPKTDMTQDPVLDLIAKHPTMTPEQRAKAIEGRIAALNAAKTPEQQIVTTTDVQGNVKLYTRGGALIKDLGKVGKPNTEVVKEGMARAKMSRDLAAIIPTLEDISRDGGLLDQATGSGLGAAVDIGAGFLGYGTPGAIAIGKLKPAVDAVLKLVPRFEGPQSDKDTKSYQDAAGNLGNPATPNSIKKEAAKTILQLYKKRQSQFVTKDYEATISAPSEGGWKDL